MLLLSGPNMGGNELKYVTECIETGWVSSVGAYVDQFERMTAEFAGTKYAVATSSGTTALHTCLVMLGVNSNDYVICPNITFIATCNSIKYTGANPIFIDTDEFTWQMDLDLLERFLDTETELRSGVCHYRKDGRRIPIIMPVHVLGNMCDMDRLLELAQKHSLVVLEDSTEALGSYYKGRHAGSFGLMGTFSYNGNKIITTGGGGMIVTDDAALAKQAKHLTTQAKSDPFEYMHDAIGYNYRLVNVAAAMGVAQMEQLLGFLERKKEIIRFYKDALSGIGDISFQEVKPDVEPNWWLPTIKTNRQRDILKILNDHKMQSRPFWVPMNQLPMFVNDIYYQKNDRSDFVYKHCLSIPCSTNITDDQLAGVADKIKKSIPVAPHHVVHDRTHRNMYKPLKRLVDLILASIALVVLLPILIPVIIILLFTGEHEVFYFQKRVGYRNSIFSIWKFATMQKNSPSIGTGEITLRNDPRVTPLGKFLRMSKINELPQIINVFKGDMSIVGPRPLMEVSFRLYPEEVRKQVYQSKPGITGIGSLIFRDEEKIISEAADPRSMYAAIYPYKGALELWYKKNASLGTDFKIIFLTAWSILFPENKLTYRFFKDLPARPF